MVSRSYHISATMSILPEDIIASPISVAALLQVPSACSGKRLRPVIAKAAKTAYVPDLLLNPPTETVVGISGVNVSRESLSKVQSANQGGLVTERSTRIQERGYKPEKPEQPSRRRLFMGYWDREVAANKQIQLGASHQSPASSSRSAQNNSTRMAHPRVDICQYSPSPALHLCLRKHHELLESVLDKQSGKIPGRQSLPPFPEPLRRLRDESISSKGCGMYPLMLPESILRTSKYVPRSNEEEKVDESAEEQSNPRSLFAGRRLNSDVQQSMRRSGGSLSDFSRPIDDVNVDVLYLQLRQLAEESKSSRGDNSKAVHFDPRIVITEFDDHVERSWYLPHELMRLKSETIMLAHQYVLLNPQVVADFSEGSFDPVTGKAKKKALFSLPVLNSLPEDFDPESFNRQLEAMLDHGVKRILVVDPNQAILQLFRKSILRIFPNAAIETVENAEDALRKYTMAIGHHKRSSKKENRSFDIMIIEEKLVRAGSRSKHKRGDQSAKARFQHDRQTASFSRLHSLNDSDSSSSSTPTGNTHKQSSFSELDALKRGPVSERRGMTGSQLIKRIRQLEDQVYGESPKEQNFRGVIIGVSANLERDREMLHVSGADKIWSKPPPPMGITLRNQLLSALISKRQGDCSTTEIKKNR